LAYKKAEQRPLHAICHDDDVHDTLLLFTYTRVGDRRAVEWLDAVVWLNPFDPRRVNTEGELEIIAEVKLI
jgi:hypothetical protein